MECGKNATLEGICENSPLRFTRFFFFLFVAGAHAQPLYRLDDHFKASGAAASAAIAEMAAPIVWQNFLSEDDITWGLARGRMGFRKGDLIVKGDGSTPVIVSPDAQPIDWALYEAVPIGTWADALTPAALWQALWPVMLGGLLAISLWRWEHLLPRVPEGDVAVAVDGTMRVAVNWARTFELADGALRRWPVASLSLLILTVTLSAAMLAGR